MRRRIRDKGKPTAQTTFYSIFCRIFRENFVQPHAQTMRRLVNRVGDAPTPYFAPGRVLQKNAHFTRKLGSFVRLSVIG
jgi:hypothetical protein